MLLWPDAFLLGQDGRTVPPLPRSSGRGGGGDEHLPALPGCIHSRAEVFCRKTASILCPKDLLALAGLQPVEDWCVQCLIENLPVPYCPQLKLVWRQEK